MEISNQEALFLSFCFKALEELAREHPEADVSEIDIPVKKIRKQGFKEDQLQRVALALETKGLIVPEYNYHDELKRVRLLPGAGQALDEHGGLRAVAAEGEAPGGAQEAAEYISALYASIRTLKKGGHGDVAAEFRLLLDELLAANVPLSRFLLEHLDALVAEAGAPKGHRRLTVINTLVEKLNKVVPPVPDVLARWASIRSFLLNS
ncbi:MAG: hypothetical protein ACOYVI_03565 [Bacillota bacterium]